MPTPESDIVRVARQYRDALAGHEASMTADMVRRWLEIETRLSNDITLLATQVADLRAAGETVSIGRIYRLERWKYLREQMEREIQRYTRQYAVSLITSNQRDYALLGIDMAQNTIYAGTGPFANFTRLNVRVVEAMFGFAGDGSPLYSLLKKSYPDAVNGLLKELINGVARGFNPAVTARNMRNGFGMGLDRAMVIARTETLRAYRTASTQQYRESGIVKGFRRLVYKPTACISCLMLDGEEFQTEDELDDHPQGKCAAIPVLNTGQVAQWEKGQDWFKNLSQKDQIDRIGQERYDLWQSGKISLSDMATKHHSDVWGDSPAPTPLNQLKGE